MDSNDLGIKDWFLDRSADPEYSSAQLADDDDEDAEDHLFAASMVAACVLTVFVVLTVASAVVLAIRLVAYFMDEI